jgi:ribonuclease P protein component
VQDSRFRLSARFTGTFRLLRVDGFDHVIRAENIVDKQFKIFFVRNYASNCRLGIIASKKVLPSSAHRNRVKRIIRERFRQHSIKLCKMDVVVLVRHDFSQQADAQIENLERLFSQVENRCAES